MSIEPGEIVKTIFFTLVITDIVNRGETVFAFVEYIRPDSVDDGIVEDICILF